MGEHKNILIVEDERVVLLDIKRTLQSIGYTVVGVASSGEEVVPAIEKSRPDLILLDIVLEGSMTGIDVANKILSTYDIPVIFLTSYSDSNTLEEAKKAGAYGYIIKPFEERELFATIEIAFHKYNTDRLLKESKRKIELLHITARKLTRMQDAEQVYQESVNAAEAILGFDTCNVQCAEDGQFVVKASSSRSMYSPGMTPDDALLKDVFKQTRCKVHNVENGVSVFMPISAYGVFQAFKQDGRLDDDDIRMLELLFGHVQEALHRISLQDNLKAQAIHDPLTGLYNRYFLYQTLENQKNVSQRYHRSIAFIMVDVNGLKEVNDKLGHLVGDDLLRQVANVLVGACRTTDIVIRSGGDEFLIILPETGEELVIIANRIQAKAEEWNASAEDMLFELSFALGYSWWTPDGDEAIEEAISRADASMYENKRAMKAEARNHG